MGFRSLGATDPDNRKRPAGAPGRRGSARGDAGTGPRVRLRILATADLHANLAAWDYVHDRPDDAVGLVRVASLIAAARAEVPGALLFDAGDCIQGTALGDAAAGVPGLHPMIAAMNRLGYDAATVGNHDFDYGAGALRRIRAGARFPVVAANLGPADAAAIGALPGVVLRRRLPATDGRRAALAVGVTGVLPQQVPGRGTLYAVPVAVAPVAASARAAAAALRAQGADIVIALAHSGIGDPAAPDDPENAVIPLASVAGIDAVICGHSHLTFPSADHPATPEVDPARGTVCGKPAAMPGPFGANLAVIDLTLARGPSGWRVVSQQSALRPIAAVAPGGGTVPLAADAPALARIAGAAHRRARRYAMRPVGRSRHAIHTFFALAGPSRALSAIAAAKRREVEALLRGTRWEGLPVLGSAAPYRTGGPSGTEAYCLVPAGVVRVRHLVGLYPHTNMLRADDVTGAALADILERSAGVFATLRPGGGDQPLLDPAMPGYAFTVLDRLSWTLDLTVPPRFDAEGRLADPGARRVRDLRFRGAPVDPAQVFVIAGNSHRGVPPAAGAERIPLPEVYVRDVLERHVALFDADHAAEGPAWRFAPVPGAAAIFRSGREAEDHRRDSGAMAAAEFLGRDGAGACLYRIRLDGPGPA